MQLQLKVYLNSSLKFIGGELKLTKVNEAAAGFGRQNIARGNVRKEKIQFFPLN